MENYKTLPGSRIGFILKITEEDLKKSQKSAIDYFRQKLSLKGFRKGQVPEELVVSTVGPQQILLEASSRSLDKKYRDFIQENKLHPISTPKIEEFDPHKIPGQAKVEVEVYPEIKLGNYKKIKMPPIKVNVTSKEIDDVIETIMSQQQIGNTVHREAKNGDQVTIDFTGKDDKGNVIKNTEGKDMKIRLGFGHFIENFEKALIGIKPGEEKKAATVKFPKDYAAKELSGNKVFFDLKCHEVLEISAKNLDETTIERLTGQKKSIEDFKKNVETMIRQNKEQNEKKKATQEYQEKLAKQVKADLPNSWLEKEVAVRLEKLKQNPQFREDPNAFWKNIGKTEDDFKKLFRPEAEKDLKTFLGLTEIVKQENIELNKDDLDKAHQIAHKRLGKTPISEKYMEELQKIILNLKIDKYLQTLTL